MMNVNNETKKVLPVVAKDNHGYTYAVHLDLSTGPDGTFEGAGAEELKAKYTNRWILRVVGTPGRWYMTDLLEHATGEVMYLDMGRDWKVVNFSEVMAVAKDNI